MDPRPVNSRERKNIEAETSINFGGKGKPIFKAQTKLHKQELDEAALKRDKKMSEGIGAMQGTHKHRKVIDTTKQGATQVGQGNAKQFVHRTEKE
jgi:hypothetical protein